MPKLRTVNRMIAQLRQIRARSIGSARCLAAAAFVAVTGWLLLQPVAHADPLLARHRVATIATPDLQQFERQYGHWLDYKVRERGRVSAGLATSWGAPKSTGRHYLLLSSDAAPDVFIRAVKTPAVRNYRPLTTYGWNAIEIIVDDPNALHSRLLRSSFKIIGNPAPLGGYPSIRAFQVTGSAAEVLYLTSETGDRSKSILPPPNGFVGRVFIMVVAGPDIEAMNDWYSSNFDLVRGQVRERMVGVLQRAQTLPDGTLLPLTTVRMSERGNLIELDGYRANTGPRPQLAGELPPGIAIASFAVPNLDALRVSFIARPQVHAGLAYGGKRSATTRGAAGELVELIEQ